MIYLDTVEIRFASSLEIGMCKFPDILLDLASIVVDMLNLSCQLDRQSSAFGSLPWRNRTC